MMLKKALRNNNFQGFFVLLVVLGVAGTYLYNNRRPQQTVSRPQAQPTLTAPALQEWQLAMQAQLAALPTASATPFDFPTPTRYIPPTLPPQSPSEPINPAPTLEMPPLPPTARPIQGFTPTSAFQVGTPVPLPTGVEAALAPPIPTQPRFQLPPEEVPLGAHPYDHFWLTRPIDVTANSQYLFYYPYGSDGDNWRVHRGIDLPNLIGQPVRAAGAGTVVYAFDGDTERGQPDPEFQSFESYGQVVVILHDFGWRGQPIWTLYAHLSSVMVLPGARVDTGDIIGLVGTTGQVSGPHVHFEVRVGRNDYAATRNPLLWMAPYIDHGVVAGRVIDEAGATLDKALVQLNRGGRVTDTTTTYIRPWQPGSRSWEVVPDDNWNENFAFGDIPAGQYQLVVVINEERIFQNITVNPGTTTFVEIRLNDIATARANDATPIPTNIPTAIPTRTATP